MLNHMVEHSSALLDRTYGALAHPIRRAMLERLTAAPLRVTDLAAPFDVSLAAASKHVRVLETADLVARTVEGREHLLTPQAQGLREAGDWIERYRSFWATRLAAELAAPDGHRIPKS